MNAPAPTHIKGGRVIRRIAAGLAITLTFPVFGAGPEVISRDIRSPEGPIFVDGIL